MTRLANLAEYERQHRDAWALLPWYVNQTLDDHERAKVEAHLDSCSRCKEEVELMVRMGKDIRHTDVLDDVMEQSLAALKARIAGNKPDNRVSPQAFRDRPVFRRLATVWQSLTGGPRAVKIVFAVQFSLLVGLAGLLGATLWKPENQAVFTTLSAPVSSPAVTGPAVRIVFAEETPERELRDVLRKFSARLVDGPSPRGVYTVVLEPTESRDSTWVQRLAELRATAVVRFVEPVSAETGN